MSPAEDALQHRGSFRSLRAASLSSPAHGTRSIRAWRLSVAVSSASCESPAVDGPRIGSSCELGRREPKDKRFPSPHHAGTTIHRGKYRRRSLVGNAPRGARASGVGAGPGLRRCPLAQEPPVALRCLPSQRHAEGFSDPVEHVAVASRYEALVQLVQHTVDEADEQRYH